MNCVRVCMFQVIPAWTISLRRPALGCPRRWTTSFGTISRYPIICISWSDGAPTTWFGSGWRPRVFAPPAGRGSERTAWTLSNTARWPSPSPPPRMARSSGSSDSTLPAPSPGTVASKAPRCSRSSGTPPAQKRAWDPAPLERTLPAGRHPPGPGLLSRGSPAAPCETSPTSSWRVSHLQIKLSLYVYLTVFNFECTVSRLLLLNWLIIDVFNLESKVFLNYYERKLLIYCLSQFKNCFQVSYMEEH